MTCSQPPVLPVQLLGTHAEVGSGLSRQGSGMFRVLQGMRWGKDRAGGCDREKKVRARCSGWEEEMNG